MDAMTASLCARGRWSALDTNNGCVQGWRKRARFLYSSGGKLRLMSTNTVLRGLHALGAGQPTSVRDGLLLSMRSLFRPQRPSQSQRACLCKCHNHRHQCQCPNSHNNGNKAPRATTETALQPLQVTFAAQSQRLTDNAPRTSQSPKRKRSVSLESVVKRVTTRRSSSVELKSRASGEEVTPTQRSETPFYCKELEINGEDVDLYRTYLIKHDSEFDLYRFDTDESYKLSVLFMFNPLVEIERCNLIRRRLRGSQASQLSLKDFARSVSDQKSVQSRRYKKRSRKEREKQLRHTSDSDEEMDKDNNYQVKLRKRPNQLEFRKIVPEGSITEQLNVLREKRVEESEYSSSSWTPSDDDIVRKKKKFISINKIRAKHRLPDETKRILLNRHNPIYDENVHTNIDKPQSNNGETHINNIKNSLRKSKDPPRENAEQQNIRIRNTRQSTTESVQAKSVKKRPSFSKLPWSSSDSDACSATGSRTPQLVKKPPKPATKPAPAAPAKHPVFNKNAPSTSKNRKPKRSGTRGCEYASLEDNTIVTYISSGNRARLVKGTRVWRQLQQDYQALTGTFRTWQSLRSRYLRILPAARSLEALRPPELAARASVARDENKTRDAKTPDQSKGEQNKRLSKSQDTSSESLRNALPNQSREQSRRKTRSSQREMSRNKSSEEIIIID